MLPLTLGLLSLAPTPHATPASAVHARLDAAYAGLSLRDTPNGTVVSWVGPGPFGGDGYRSDSLWRGDWIASVNERAVTAESFRALLQALAPGDELRVVFRRRPDAEEHIGDAVPSGDPAGEERSVKVVLAARSAWSGTLEGPLRADVFIGEAREGAHEREILARAAKAGLRELPDGVDALLAHVKSVQERQLDANASPWVVQALRRPLSLDAVEEQLAGAVRGFALRAKSPAESFTACAELVRFALDGTRDARATPERAAGSRAVAEDAAQWREVALDVVRAHRDSVSLPPALAERGLALVRASPSLASRVLDLELARLSDAVLIESELSGHALGVPEELRERVAAAVRGEVSAAFVVDGELCVVGGSGKNEYAMERLAHVYDRGGADTYLWKARSDAREQCIFDLAGDDTYESLAEFAGPGVAVFGLALVDDRAGDDTYRTHTLFSQACGLFGIGLVLDRRGDDTYESSSPHSGFAQGVGYWGAGLLVDVHGDDRYLAQKLSQGVGGPRGFGALIELGGADRYTANGPSFPSVYGTPDVFVGMSQGMGYGLRRDAAGGLGVLFDLAGDDHYDVGEFGQGCGYFFGFGVLHDSAGKDEYLGQRYAQGTGAHQAAGMLVDERGDDRYTCKQVAFQGGAWDETVAWLLDREGDDVYIGAGLGQGAAAQQALGVLVDLGGKDRYESPQAQGESGANDYHYATERVLSFSVLLDRGGAKDTYSCARPNEAATATGARNEGQPAASTLYGLCIDD